MKQMLILIALFFVLAQQHLLGQSGVQAGIFNPSDTVLVIKAKPTFNMTNKLFTSYQVTIQWPTSYGVSLGSPTSSYGVTQQKDTVIGSNRYRGIIWLTGANVYITWAANSENELLRIPINQTGQGTGTFYLSNNLPGYEWYFEVGDGDSTGQPPFYQPSTEAPLPIQMAAFAANLVRDKEVEVVWRTVSETNNYGFEIYRKRGDSGDWKKLGFVEGHGTTLAPQSYTYLDKSLSFGKYFYRIKQIDLDGKSETFPEMEVSVGIVPDKMILTQNYPNPFNPSTLIDFVVPKSGPATMKVYNVLGQEVATLFEGNAEVGTIYTVRFNASNVASGLYFYRLRSSGKVDTKRMLLLK